MAFARVFRRVLRPSHRRKAGSVTLPARGPTRHGGASCAALMSARDQWRLDGAVYAAVAAALLLHDAADAAHCDAQTFAGQWAAVVTEFDASGAASTKNVDRYAAHLRREGCVGVFVCGTSGESMSLSVGERERLAEAWAASGARHGLRVIVHVGCDALLDAERLARHAASLGIDGVAAMAPRFVKCENADALAAYCAAVARAAPATPFFYYHFPLATGVATKPSQLVRAALAAIPTFAGMKYSAADMWEYGECCDADADGRLAFLPGFGGPDARAPALPPPELVRRHLTILFDNRAPAPRRGRRVLLGPECRGPRPPGDVARLLPRGDAVRLDAGRQARARRPRRPRLAALPRAVAEPVARRAGRAAACVPRPRETRAPVFRGARRGLKSCVRLVLI